MEHYTWAKIETVEAVNHSERIAYIRNNPKSPCGICHYLGKTKTGGICLQDMGRLVDLGDCFEQTAFDDDYPNIEEWLRPTSRRIKGLMLLALVTLITEEEQA